jgi:hypothetical protein
MPQPPQLVPYRFKPNNAGRPPGPNKLTQFLREVMGSTFHKIGGPEAFAEWAMTHKTEFYTKLWIKLLPDSSQLSEEEREKVIDAMIGVQKVITQVYTGEEQVKEAEVVPVNPQEVK